MSKKSYNEDFLSREQEQLDEQPEQQAEPEAPAEPMKVDFDAWWAMVERKIPAAHRKEVIWADMRSRGLSSRESLAAYHEGLEKYGLKLK